MAKKEFDLAEKENSSVWLNVLYKIYLFIPILVFVIGLVGAIIAGIATKDFLMFFEIFGTTVFVVIVLIMSMVFTRLFMYHTERINRNTEEILELLKAKLENESKEKTIEPVKEEKIIDDSADEVDKSIEIIENLLNERIIDDNKFNSALYELKLMGHYRNCDNLVLYYNEKYKEMVKEKTDYLEGTYKKTIASIENILSVIPLDMDELNRQLEKLKSIGDYKDAKVKYDSYVTKIDDYYDVNFETYYHVLKNTIKDLNSITDSSSLVKNIGIIQKKLDDFSLKVSVNNIKKLIGLQKELQGVLKTHICDHYEVNDYEEIYDKIMKSIEESGIDNSKKIIDQNLEYLRIFKNNQIIKKLINKLELNK